MRFSTSNIIFNYRDRYYSCKAYLRKEVDIRDSMYMTWGFNIDLRTVILFSSDYINFRKNSVGKVASLVSRIFLI